MKLSTSRILTTHTGSLPRPADLVELLTQNDQHKLADPAALAKRTTSAVAEIVRAQADAGIDVVNDGEAGKPGYSTYVKDRLTGFEGQSRVTTVPSEGRLFPEWQARRSAGGSAIQRPACNGPVAWRDFEAVKKDIADLKAALQGVQVEEAFLSAASPGVIATFLPNEYYPSDEQYIEALAEVMRQEYNAIVEAGFILQLDCPDFAMTRHNRHVDKTTEEFRAIVAMHVEAVNAATRDIAPEQMRVHLCWGNYEGPHHLDVELKDIVDLVLKARPAGISFEGANPRHAHEWIVWQDVKLPDDRYLLPGVIDSTTNFIEHPELIAQRIERYASVVGRERVIASSDCGFGTFATSDNVDPRITWAKLAALAEGARIASSRLY